MCQPGATLASSSSRRPERFSYGFKLRVGRMGQALTTSSDEATDAARSSEAVGFFADDCPFTELVNELAHASKGDRQVVKMLEAQHVDRKNEFMQIVLAIQRLSDIYDTTRLSRRKLTLREVVLSLQASRSSRCTCESCPERQHLAHSLRLRRSAFVGLLQLVRALLRDALRRRASVRASVRRGACPHGCLCVRARAGAFRRALQDVLVDRKFPTVAARTREVAKRGGGGTRCSRSGLCATSSCASQVPWPSSHLAAAAETSASSHAGRGFKADSSPWQALHGTALLRMCAVRAAHADRTFVVVGGVGAVTKPVLIARLTACASYA